MCLLLLSACKTQKTLVFVDEITGNGMDISETKISESHLEEWRNLMDSTNTDGFWYRRSLTSFYQKPQDLDLFFFFYDGFPGRKDNITEDELTYLKQIYDNDSQLETDLSFDFYRLSVSEMNDITQKYLGMAFSDQAYSKFDHVPFREETQTYYLFKTDSRESVYQIQDIYRLTDGNIGIIYTSSRLPDVPCLAVFHEKNQIYQSVFNWPLDGYNYYIHRK